jgi:hypothetical protein
MRAPTGDLCFDGDLIACNFDFIRRQWFVGGCGFHCAIRPKLRAVTRTDERLLIGFPGDGATFVGTHRVDGEDLVFLIGVADDRGGFAFDGDFDESGFVQSGDGGAAFGHGGDGCTATGRWGGATTVGTTAATGGEGDGEGASDRACGHPLGKFATVHGIASGIELGEVKSANLSISRAIFPHKCCPKL